MTTAEIQGILVKSASDLIDLDAPNYQYVIARLLLFGLRKNLYGRIHELPTLLDQIKRGVDKGIYDGDILNKYTKSEIEDLDKIIDHERDYLFTYAVLDKLLISIWYRTETLVLFMRPLSLCTCYCNDYLCGVSARK